MKTRYPSIIVGCILALVLLISSCSATPSTTTPVNSSPSSTPGATTSGPAKPQGELIASLVSFGNEDLLPWHADNGSSQICDLVYDLLTYWDELNRKFIPGLAESWESSPDALTLTYHLRKGVQFSDGWGELTSADVKYNFEKQAGKDSIGQTTAARNVSSMDTPDPYTLVIQFKRPAPTFVGTFSFGYGGQCQGIVSKKYVETVGETTAAQKPVGSGPYKVIDSSVASYYKFEALDNHWRVVPEFKTLTVKCVPELSTSVAMLKNKEIDLAMVTAEQLPNLKSSGLATEIYQGGVNLVVQWGGLFIPEDSRYDPAVDNKAPWTDIRVRKAMTISIDREAICKAIYAGGATPIGVPEFAPGFDKYQYPFDPTSAKQLLSEAGYPNGFSFKAISSVNPGMPEAPRIVEAICGYWQQIGLDPQIVVMDYNAYGALRRDGKTAGQVALYKITAGADMLDKASLVIIPDCAVPLFQDEGSYSIWKEGNSKINLDERADYAVKLNQYFYDNYGPIPVINLGSAWAWNSAKVSPFPHPTSSIPYYLEYVRHAQPLNTFRLFSPFAGR